MKLLFMTCLFAIFAQEQPKATITLQFEVAAFKRAAPDDFRRHVVQRTPGGYQGVNAPLDEYLEMAYRLRSTQISGPGWIRNDRYDMEAKTGRPVTAEEMCAMLQHLLVDRLHIQLHHETRHESGYSLEVAGKAKVVPGDKLQPPWVMPNPEVLGGHSFQNATMSFLAYYLSREIDQPIVDNTGLAGVYNFNVPWNSGPMRIRHNGELETAVLEAPGPTVFDGVREVGLKLVASKVPVDCLVIDKIDKIPVEQ